MRKRAGIYCRISHDPSLRALGVARQEEDCRRLCEQSGWEVVEPIYVDNDRSASSKSKVQRPEFDRLLADVRSGLVQVVVAWDFDRLTRRPRELESVVEDYLKPAGADLATIGDRIDSISGDGMLVARMKAAVADEEIRKTSQRVTRKRQERAERGRVDSGGKRPFGYQKNRVKLRKREAEAIRYVVDFLLDEGGTLGGAVRWLKASGLRPSGGGTWCITGLKAILQGGRIAGLGIRKGEIIGTAAWEPIIDEATWYRLQAWLATRSPGRPPVRPRVLARLVWCHCGRKMTVGSRSSGVSAYECRRQSGGCGAYMTAGLLEKIVLARVGEWVADPGVLAALQAAVDGAVSATNQMSDDLAELEANLALVAKDFGEGVISHAEWKAASIPLRARINSLKEQVELRPRVPKTPKLGTVDMARLIRLWEQDLTLEERRSIVELMADITVNRSVGHGGASDPNSRVVIRRRWEDESRPLVLV